MVRELHEYDRPAGCGRGVFGTSFLQPTALRLDADHGAQAAYTPFGQRAAAAQNRVLTPSVRVDGLLLF
jgi:hypothetical protein